MRKDPFSHDLHQMSFFSCFAYILNVSYIFTCQLQSIMYNKNDRNLKNFVNNKNLKQKNETIENGPSMRSKNSFCHNYPKFWTDVTGETV